MYLALADGGGVVGMTDSYDKNSESVGDTYKVVYICWLVILCHTYIHEQTFSLFPSS